MGYAQEKQGSSRKDVNIINDKIQMSSKMNKNFQTQ